MHNIGIPLVLMLRITVVSDITTGYSGIRKSLAPSGHLD